MTVLKSGDLVVLKSGGPLMTVDTVNTDIFDDNKVTGILCAWFNGEKLERARFDQGALAPARDVSAPEEVAGEEAVGEYVAVLDEMVAALNAAVEAPKRVSRTATERSRRISLPKSETGLVGPRAQVD